MMVRRARTHERGVVLLFAMATLASLLTLTSVMLTRSMTELSAAQWFVAGAQAFHVAESGVDDTIRQLVVNPAFNGHAANDPANPLIATTLSEGTFTTEVTALESVLNPVASSGTGSAQRFGFAMEQLFQVTATGTVRGVTRTIEAMLARSTGPWQGTAAIGPILLDQNTGEIYPGDTTEIVGNLLSDWGAVHQINNDPGVLSRPIQIPAGTTVTGDVTIGLPSLPTSSPLPGPWVAYVDVFTNPPWSHVGVWVESVPQTITVVNPADSAPDDPLGQRHGFLGAQYTPNYYNGQSYELPAGSVTGQKSAGTSTALIAINDALLVPPDPSACTSAYRFDVPNAAGSTVLDGGILCYRSYYVGENDTVYYKQPTTIYITGGRVAGTDEDAMIYLHNHSNVGMPQDPQNPPANPQPSDFLDGGVDFRSTGTREVHLRCLTNLHGSLLAPHAPIILRHWNAPWNDPIRGLRTGSVLGYTVEFRAGINVTFLSDGSPAGSWPRITVKSWREK